MIQLLRKLVPHKAVPAPSSVGALKTQGDTHLKRGEWDEAAKCYRQALAGDPGNAEACINLGFVLCEQRALSEAEEWLRRAQTLAPQTADVHYLLGRVAKLRDNPDSAIAHFNEALRVAPAFDAAYRDLYLLHLERGEAKLAADAMTRATSLCPHVAEFWFHLGNLRAQDNELEGAIDSYKRAVSLEPTSSEAHFNLAQALAHRRDFAQAVECYGKVLSLGIDDANVYIYYGGALHELGRAAEAVAAFERALALGADSAPVHIHLGNNYLWLGETVKAIASFERALALAPTSGLEHLVAALSGGTAERAPSRYVETLFDAYADKFDSHLVNVLHYSVPQQLADLLAQVPAPVADKWEVLDLGCGTGLSALPIADRARKIVGVDLSENMLEKARSRNVYDRLVHADLMRMMREEASSSYDVAIAADVLVYLGTLDDLVAELGRLLRSGGLFAFSVEALEPLAASAATSESEGDYRLTPTGRYAHSLKYIRALAANSGFEVAVATPSRGRVNDGKAVEAHLVVLRKTETG